MFNSKENSSNTKLRGNNLCSLRMLLFVLIAICLSATANAATYYLDANNGNDSNNGSINSPWRTINRAKTIGGGNTVIVSNGRYGQFFDSTIRSDWLTFKAAEGHRPHLDRISVGKDRNFNGSVYLRFDGFLVKPPVGFNDKIVKSKGGNYFQILNSRIMGTANPAKNNAGYWDLNHGAVWIVANHIKVDHCEISDALRGIELRQMGFPNINHVEELTNNYVHDCAGTGIFLFEQARAKIEYNHVYRQRPYRSTSGAAQHGSGIGIISPEVSIRYNIVHSYGNSGGINFYTVQPWNGVNTNSIIENNLVYDSGGMRIAGIKSGCKVNNNTVIGHASANGTSLTTTNERRYAYGSIGLIFAGGYAGDLECYNNLSLGLISNNIGAKISAGGNICWDYEYPKPFRYSNTALPNSTIAHPNYNFLERGMFIQDPIDFSWPQDQANRKYCNQLFQDFRLVEGSPAINYGNVAKQTAKGLGTIGPDGFIQHDGIARDAFHHSTGAYEFGPAQPGAPYMEAIGDQAGFEDEMISFSIKAADPEGDALTFSASSLPSGAILDENTGDFAWIPNIGQAGQYEITLTVSDGTATHSRDVVITVYPKDVFAPEIKSVTAGTDFVAVNFSEAVDPVSAENIANYTIDNGISITAAIVEAGSNVAILTTSAHVENVTYTLTATDISDMKENTMAQASKTYRFTNGLVGAWKFNAANTTTSEDLSGNGSTGTITGATWTSQSELSFDGLDDNVRCGKASHLNLTGDLTISAWINPVTYGQSNYGRIVDKGSASTGFSFMLNGTNASLGYSPYGQGLVWSNANAVDLNLWQNVVVSYNQASGTAAFYVNGESAGSASCPAPPVNALGSDLCIGIRGYDNNRAFKGLIDDVRVYNRTLSAAEIAGFYTDGKLLFDPIGNRTVNENQTLAIKVATSSQDVTVDVQPLPQGAVFVDNTLAWKPTYDQAGKYNVDFIATDGEIEDIESITITVNNVNRQPVIDPISNMTVNEGALVNFKTSATDADGDTVTVTGDNLPAGSTFSGNTFNWTPAADQAGENVMSFIASDGELEDVETVIITVNRTSVNTAPVLNAIGSKTVDEEQTVTFTAAASDAEGDAITYSADPLPQGATFANGTFAWTPELGQAGTYSFTITASDGVLTDSKTVTVTVNEVVIDIPEVPTSDFDLMVSFASNRSGAVSLDQQIVTGDIFVFVATASGIKTVEFFIDDPAMTSRVQRESYAPYDLKGGNDAAANAFDTTTLADGTHTMIVAVTETTGKVQMVEAVFTVKNHIHVNTAPVMNAVNDVTVDEKTAIDFDVTATDADGDALTYAAVNLPQGASFTNGTFAWTPATGQAGTYTVTFTVTDGEATDSATMVIVVNAVVVEVPEVPTSDFDLMVSFDSNRSGAVALDQQAVAGDIFVYVTPASGIAQVEFFIDDQDMTSRIQLERAAPYDLRGGNDAAANAFDTTQLTDGDHTMTVRIKLSNGTTQVATAEFKVANNVYTIPEGFGLMISSSSNRSNAVSLNGEDVSGKVYIFLKSEKSLSQVRFYMDNPAMTASPMQTERVAPYDLRGGSSSTANAFDTSALAAGTHVLVAEATLRDGTKEIVAAYFTK